MRAEEKASYEELTHESIAQRQVQHLMTLFKVGFEVYAERFFWVKFIESKEMVDGTMNGLT